LVAPVEIGERERALAMAERDGAAGLHLLERAGERADVGGLLRDRGRGSDQQAGEREDDGWSRRHDGVTPAAASGSVPLRAESRLRPPISPPPRSPECCR